MTDILFEGSSKFFQKYKSHLLMTFKDNVHGKDREDVIHGTGELRKRFTYYFYRYLEQHGIQTHLLSNIDDTCLLKGGLLIQHLQAVKMEIIVRNIARGHWVDNHKIPLFSGGTLFKDPIIEICLKWKYSKESGVIVDDPRISPDIAIALHYHAKNPSFRENMITNKDEYKTIKNLALKINKYYKFFLKEHGWILEDFKFELGITPEREFVLIDEISPDCSRIRDIKGNSLTKDLFRQAKPSISICRAYEQLAKAIENKYKYY